MTDKELKKLSRAQLLELLIEKTSELEQVKGQLDEALEQLSDRGLAIESAGTMAEAALQINGIFEAADRAAQQYLEYAKQQAQKQAEICAQMESESRDKAEQMLIEAEVKCRRLERDAQLRSTKLLRNAEQEAGKRWDELFARLDQLQAENNQLRQMMESGEKKRKWNL